MPEKWKIWLNTAAASLVAVIFSFPFIWMIAASLKTREDIFSTGLSLWGRTIAFSNYVEAFTRVNFGRFVLNGFIVAGVGTLGTLIVATLSAYAFARLQFRYRQQLFGLFIAVMLLPQEVLLIPQFMLIRSLGMMNSFQGLILPALFNTFGVFLLRQFMLSIPTEFEEAALIDGASRHRIVVSIVVPLVKPALAVLSVFAFIGYWNSFLWPLVITTSTDMATVPLGLSMFRTQYTDAWQLVMTGCVISTLPSIALVAFAQRYLSAGVNVGGFGGR